MGARTGAAFLRGLRDGRELWVGGERVTDPADHPATRGAAHTLAAIFDLQHQHGDVCLLPDPETGEPIGASHMIPRSRADLERRDRADSTRAASPLAAAPDAVEVDTTDLDADQVVDRLLELVAAAGAARAGA